MPNIMKQSKSKMRQSVIGQSFSSLPKGYSRFLSVLKERIKSAQIKAALSVNKELIRLYWDLGRGIIERQEREGWGTGVIERLAADLQTAFPGIKGFSTRNIWKMRTFYLAYTQDLKELPQLAAEIGAPKLPQVVAEIPWGQNILLIEKIKDPKKRFWYAQKILEHGWSRAVLWHQIESSLYERQGMNKKLTNFSRTLPPVQSDLAHEMMKDPYNFDFLTLEEDVHERELEQGLLNHIRAFLMELGKGFSFVGSQYHLQVGDEDFYIDLLFYHLELRRFIVLELKTTEFKPEYAGKMNFYLSAVDQELRHPDDKPSIGMILCKTKNKIIVEYALRDTHKPIGVSSYKLTHSLPKQLESSLPTIKELEEELGGERKNKRKR